MPYMIGAGASREAPGRSAECFWQVSLNGLAPSDGHDGAYAKLLYSGDDRASAPLCSAEQRVFDSGGTPSTSRRGLFEKDRTATGRYLSANGGCCL
jgi:hypothetical protein